MRNKYNFLFIVIFMFIVLGLSSCKKESGKIIIESFDYEINRNKSTVADALSYTLSFDIDFSLNKKLDVDDLVVRISTVEKAIVNKKSFHFNIDNSNTENVVISPSTEQYPYILLKYAIVDVTTLNVNAQIKISSKDLMDDINNFIKIDCYCESKEIVDKNNILNNGFFKISYSDEETIHYEFDEFSESYKIVSAIVRDETYEIPATYKGYPVETIGEGAFYGCISIKNITVPDSITSIGEDAFEDCDNIEKATIPTLAIPFIPKKNLKEVIITSGTSIGEYAFSTCDKLTSITIPNSVTSIGKSAFEDCSSLTSITIPKSILDIGYDAFYNCYRLVEIYDLSSIDITIGSRDNGFIGAYAKVIHTSLEEQSNLITKADYIFIEDKKNKYYLVGYKGIETKLILPNEINGNIYEINACAFNGCGLTSIIVPKSVISIGESAFRYCYNLVEIYNLSSIDITIGNEDNGYIGYYAKVIHTSLEEESNLITKADYVFYKDNENKYYLVGYNGTETEIVLPNDIEGNNYEINRGAFYKCRSLTSITIPFVGASLNETMNTHFGYIFGANSYDDNAKYVPSSLKEVIITGGKSIGKSAFYGCSNLTSMTIPFVGASINETENTHFGYIFGARYNFDNSKYVPSNLKEVKITSGTSIGNYAFENCSSLISITIPNSVTSIGDNAFRECSSLTSVTIGNSVTSIGGSAFYNCSNLASITIPNNVTSIEWCAFYNCSSLTSITIPNSVTSIGYDAIYGCSSLKEIYYKGTSKEWNRISIEESLKEDNISKLTSSTIYYYSETKPKKTGNYWHYVDGKPIKW